MDIYSLSWYKIKAIFKDNIGGVLNFSVIQAIIKGSYLDTFPDFDWDDAPIFFHVKDRNIDSKLKKEQEFLIEIIITRHTLDEVSKVIVAIQKRMEIIENQKRYSLVSIENPEHRNLKILEKEVQVNFKNNELTLNFLTPYSMVQRKDFPSGWINTEKFLFKFKMRLNSFFKVDLDFTNGEYKNIDVIPYWNYKLHYHHPSKSQKNTTQNVKGFIGKLYIKGDIKKILPLIILGSELHTGSRKSNAQGYYKILPKSLPHFDTYFPNQNQILKILEDTIEHYDVLDKEISNKKDFLNNLPKFAKEIQDDINNENFEYSPSQSFKLVKKDKTFRMVERFNFKEVVINNYILNTVYESLNRFIAEESIGYRRGVSREKAIFFIKQNLKDGYDIILESDVEAFFPSINLEKLEEVISRYLPSMDVKVKRIMLKSINSKYKKGSEIIDRKIGLAQGSSLSPILANLYLNSFDKQIKNENVRLIRYADDFIVMTKTFDQAIDSLKKMELFLGELNLKIKQSKTVIKSISDGFNFLGYYFKGHDNDTDISSTIELLKKPIYIVEPYINIVVKHDSLDLIKEKKVISSLPIRRVSEIIIMNSSLLSSALIKKCREYKIPISFTFGTGYDITTIKPDSKSWYEISNMHYNKYNTLKYMDILEIAKEIILNKIDNTAKLFLKRDNLLYSDISKRFNSLKDKIQLSNDIDTIRGYEGIAARESFRKYNYLIIPKEFHIIKRERFSKERINSLLNLGYYILFIRINTTMRALGLNPYLGFIHSKKNTYESLVSDIQELFRAHIDDFIIKIINLKVIEKDDFFETEKGLKLSYEGRKSFINAIEGEFNKKDKYGETLSSIIYSQLLNLRNWALNQENLVFYKWKI